MTTKVSPIYDDPRLVWLPGGLLLLALIAAAVSEPGAYHAAFALAAFISIILVYGRHADSLHNLKTEKDEWRSANLQWTNVLAAAIGWVSLFVFLEYRLNLACTGSLQSMLQAWTLSVRGTDIAIVLISFLGITGQLATALTFGKTK
ncbi:MAG TPA: hypothetical protein VJK50_03935 [Patescibacteria group bacterium]|nr:hypothetical protein [Patescibacteria group bacterium]